jgi:hypothetical protein
MSRTPSKNFFRRHPILGGMAVFAVALFVLLLLFDWNWMRHPLESYISKKTNRTFEIADLDVKIGLTPTIRMQGLTFGNADWGEKQPMAAVKRLEFSPAARRYSRCKPRLRAPRSSAAPGNRENCFARRGRPSA